MEFDDDQESYSGGRGGPIVGAIFMANHQTRRECLSRKLFGLPPPQANFVKKVKSGMLLFLFEFEERKLYGVFQASSDGAMNIVPNAFRSSGKQFPAQIRIKSIWYCHPLVERDFRPAIRDNYYAANKFNLGLSKDQVADLLWLFESRKMKVPKFRTPLPRERHANRSSSVDCGKVDVFEDDEHIHDNGKNKLTMDNEPASLTRDPGFRQSGLNVSSVSGQYIPDPDNSTFRGRDESFSLGHASSRTWSPPGSRRSSVWDGNSSVKKYGGNVRVFEDDDNGKNRHRMDNEPASLARDPGFQQSDLNVSSVSGHILDPHNSIFRGRDESISLGHVSSHTWSPPGSRKGSLLGGDSSVKRYGGLDGLTSLEDYIPLASENHFDHSRYSRYENMNLTSSRDQEGLIFRDPPLATNRSLQDGQFGRENLSSSVNPGNDSPYIPDYSFPAASRHEGSPYSSLREGLNFGDPSLATVPSSRRVNFGREDFRSSFISGTDPPYIPEYHTPASLQHEHTPASLQYEGPPYSNFHPSSNSHLHAGDDPLTQNFHSREQRDQDKPSEVRKDDYGAHVGLKSDVQSKRISVFSRLNSSRKGSIGDGDGCIGDNIDQADMTLEQLMDMLHQSENRWRSATKISRHKTELADDESSKTNSMHSVSENYPLANLEQQCDAVVVEDTIVNFKRRSKMREVKGVMDGCVEGDDFSGTSLRKRRKLSRPSFVSGGTHEMGFIGDGSNNLSILSQENHECNDECGETLVNGGENVESNTGLKEKYEGNTCENGELLNHSSGVEAPEKPTSQNSDVQVVVHPVCSENNSGKTNSLSFNLQDFKVRVEAYVQELSKGTEDKNPDREVVTEGTHINREGDIENTGSRELEKCVDASSACEENRKTESLLPKFDNTKVHSSTENSDLKVGQKESSESELSEEVGKAKAVDNRFIESNTNLQSCSNHKS